MLFGFKKVKRIFYYFLAFLFLPGCASYQQFQYITEEYEIPSILLNTDYNQAWQAVIQVMRKYDIAIENQAAGIVRTRWIDNTQELNFIDSFSKNDSIKSAKFKIIINVVKGYRNNREVSKVTVYRRQLVEQDFLQGWKEVPSDGIQEKTLLYRIERLVTIENKIRNIEKIRESEQIQKF